MQFLLLWKVTLKVFVKALSKQIPILESEHKEIEKMIKEEEAPYPVLTEKGVAFFLTQLKRENHRH